jgi:hypothetical protein
VLFRARNVPLPTPERLTKSWVVNIIHVNYVASTEARDRLTMWQMWLLCLSSVCKQQSTLPEYRFTFLPPASLSGLGKTPSCYFTHEIKITKAKVVYF